MNWGTRLSLTSTLPRPLTTALKSRWTFWGSSIALGFAVVLFSWSVYPLWMDIKPEPTTIGQPLLSTPFAPLATWLPFVLLYVPDMVILLGAGLVAGFFLRRLWWQWLSTCVLTYAIIGVIFGGGIWRRTVGAIIQINLADLMRYGSMCVLVLSSAYVGALVARHFKGADYQPGFCKKCGYSLHGLSSNACPECGKPFSPNEANSTADTG